MASRNGRESDRDRARRYEDRAGRDDRSRSRARRRDDRDDYDDDDREDHGVFMLVGRHADSFLDRLLGPAPRSRRDDDDEDQDDDDDAPTDPEPDRGHPFFRSRRRN